MTCSVYNVHTMQIIIFYKEAARFESPFLSKTKSGDLGICCLDKVLVYPFLFLYSYIIQCSDKLRQFSVDTFLEEIGSFCIFYIFFQNLV